MNLAQHPMYSLIVIALGVLVLIYGVTVEGEPTAVALFLIITGTFWFFYSRTRLRTQK
jgi:Flp pilus assembly protein TadB